MSRQRAVKVTAVIFFSDEEDGCPPDDTLKWAIVDGCTAKGYDAQDVLITGHELEPETEAPNVADR